MPIYTLQGPDGRKYRIEGPAGATADQLSAVITGGSPQQTYDPTEGMSTQEKFWAGAGKAATDLVRGAGQVIGLVSRKDIEEARKNDAALMKTTAGTWGNIAGNIAATIPAMLIPGANTLRGSAAIGAGMGLLQPSTSTQETVQNTLLGGAGGALGYGATKLITASPAAQAAAAKAAQGAAPIIDETASAGITPSQQAIMQWAEKQGLRTTPGQATGNRALQQLEARLESQPLTSGIFNNIKDKNTAKFNEIAAASIGEKSKHLGPEVLEAAKDRISGVYKMVASDTKQTIDQNMFLNRLAAIEQDASALIYNSAGEQVSLASNPLVKRALDYAANGEATGRQLQDTASRLGKVAYQEMTSPMGNRELGIALNGVKELVDDTLEAGLSGQTKQLFQDARGQYRNLMMLTKGTGTVDSAGNAKMGALANTLKNKDKAGMVFNKNQSDLYQAARFADSFKSLVNDSGTATRLGSANIADFIASIPVSLAGGVYTSRPAIQAAIQYQKGLIPKVADPVLLRGTQIGAQSTGAGLLNTIE